MQRYTKRDLEFIKVFDSIPKHASGILYIVQRFGKTKLMLSHIRRAQYTNVLWVVKDRTFIDNGLKADCEKFGFQDIFPYIRTQTYASLHKETGNYDLIVLDEFQSITERNSITLRNRTLSSKYLLAMSGTMTKDKTKKEIIERVLGLRVLVEYGLDEAVGSGIVADYNIEVYKIALSEEKNITVKTKNYNFKTSEKLQYNNITNRFENAKKNLQGRMMKYFAITRSMQLANLESKRQVIPKLIKGRTLIFVESRKVAESLKYYYHGSSSEKYLKLFQKEEIPYLALIRKASVGFNYHNIDTVIIMKSDTDANGTTIQKIMRGFINDRKVTIKILCSKDTVDERAVNNTLKNFNPKKVRSYDI